jgi:hypothetical protein
MSAAPPLPPVYPQPAPQDPWDAKPTRHDPKQPHPKLDLKQLAFAVGRELTGVGNVAKTMFDALVDGAATVAAAKQRQDEAWLREYKQRQDMGPAREPPSMGPLRDPVTLEPLNSNDPVSMARYLEGQYILAESRQNTQAMAGLAEALWKLLEAFAKKKGMQDENEQVQAEIMRNAPNLGSVVLQLSREELRRLRESPTPEEVDRIFRTEIERVEGENRIEEEKKEAE